MGKFKKSSQKIKSTRKGRLSTSTPKPLLLAYTYYLNSTNLCKVIIGFNTETFEPELVFYRVGISAVKLNSQEWNFYYQRFKEVEEKRLFNESQIPEDIEEYLIINFTKKHTLRFGDAEASKKFVLWKSEWSTFEPMIEFINCVMEHNVDTSNSVKDYFKLYTSKCIENNAVQLYKDSHFNPVQMDKNFNFSRLFYEIPLLSKKKLSYSLRSCNKKK